MKKAKEQEAMLRIRAIDIAHAYSPNENPRDIGALLSNAKRIFSFIIHGTDGKGGK
jgi:hypothetical protein